MQARWTWTPPIPRGPRFAGSAVSNFRFGKQCCRAAASSSSTLHAVPPPVKPKSKQGALKREASGHTGAFGPRVAGHPSAFTHDAKFLVFVHLNETLLRNQALQDDDPSTDSTDSSSTYTGSTGNAGSTGGTGNTGSTSNTNSTGGTSNGTLAGCSATCCTPRQLGLRTRANRNRASLLLGLADEGSGPGNDSSSLVRGRISSADVSMSGTLQENLQENSRHPFAAQSAPGAIPAGGGGGVAKPGRESGASLLLRVARAVARSGAVDTKELLEATEFVERVRRRVRAPCMLDLAAGNGLVGLLLAAVEPQVQEVIMVDQHIPKSFTTLHEAVMQAAPWVRGKVTFVARDLRGLQQELALQAMSEGVPTRSRPPPQQQGVSSLIQLPMSREELDRVESQQHALQLHWQARGQGQQEQQQQGQAQGQGQPGHGQQEQKEQGQQQGQGQQGQGQLEQQGQGQLEQQEQNEQGQGPQGQGQRHPGKAAVSDGLAGQMLKRAARSAVGIVAVHACGSLTDTCLQIAMLLRAPIAAMPCCYTSTARGMPLGVRRALGVAMAADVQRCTQLQSAGCYGTVDFSAIPKWISPMNRILVAAR